MQYRIYYNRADAAPHVFSVDEGSTLSEINVHTVILEGGIGKTEFNPDAIYPEPKAWVSFFGELSMEGGCAVIRRKTPPQQPTKPSPEYLAGFIDGEGCLGISKLGVSHYTPNVSITNTNKELLELIRAFFGGALYSNGSRKEGHKQAYHIAWEGSKKVAALLDSVQPHLVNKQEQAKVLRSLMEHLSAVSYKKGAGVKVPEEVVAYRESLKQQIRVLNKRGT